MSSVLLRLLWILIVAGLTAYAAYLVIGSAIQAEADLDLKRIVARDLIDRGAHNISGMVFVPTGCHELSVRAEEMPDNTQHIVFSTWEAPYVECVREPIPRAFSVVVFKATADVKFIATVNDEPVPFTVLPMAGRRL